MNFGHARVIAAPRPVPRVPRVPWRSTLVRSQVRRSGRFATTMLCGHRPSSSLAVKFAVSARRSSILRAADASNPSLMRNTRHRYNATQSLSMKSERCVHSTRLLLHVVIGVTVVARRGVPGAKHIAGQTGGHLRGCLSVVVLGSGARTECQQRLHHLGVST